MESLLDIPIIDLILGLISTIFGLNSIIVGTINLFSDKAIPYLAGRLQLILIRITKGKDAAERHKDYYMTRETYSSKFLAGFSIINGMLFLGMAYLVFT